MVQENDSQQNLQVGALHHRHIYVYALHSDISHITKSLHTTKADLAPPAVQVWSLRIQRLSEQLSQKLRQRWTSGLLASAELSDRRLANQLLPSMPYLEPLTVGLRRRTQQLQDLLSTRLVGRGLFISLARSLTPSHTHTHTHCASFEYVTFTRIELRCLYRQFIHYYMYAVFAHLQVEIYICI